MRNWPVARTSASSSSAWRIVWRSAIGLRASSPSRSADDSIPTCLASSTTRCSAPAASMSTAASTASCRAGTVGTGERAISLTG